MHFGFTQCPGPHSTGLSSSYVCQKFVLVVCCLCLLVTTPGLYSREASTFQTPCRGQAGLQSAGGWHPQPSPWVGAARNAGLGRSHAPLSTARTDCHYHPAQANQYTHLSQVSEQECFIMKTFGNNWISAEPVLGTFLVSSCKFQQNFFIFLLGVCDEIVWTQYNKTSTHTTAAKSASPDCPLPSGSWDLLIGGWSNPSWLHRTH